MRGRNDQPPAVENSDFAKMVRRMVHALGRRAGGDIDTLPLLRELVDQAEEVMRASVEQCRAEGYSWGEIAQRLGTSRQAAQQRYGRTTGQQPGSRQGGLDAELPFGQEA